MYSTHKQNYTAKGYSTPSRNRFSLCSAAAFRARVHMFVRISVTIGRPTVPCRADERPDGVRHDRRPTATTTLTRTRQRDRNRYACPPPVWRLKIRAHHYAANVLCVCTLLQQQVAINIRMYLRPVPIELMTIAKCCTWLGMPELFACG